MFAEVLRIDEIPECDRPRERLRQHGPEAISTAELIAVILGSGIKGMSVYQLSHEIIRQFGSLEKLAQATLAELCQIRGLGPAKAIQLLAAIHLGTRLARHRTGHRPRIASPEQVFELMHDELANEKRELFIVVLLDTKSQLISHEIVSIGTLARTLVHPREVFYPAIRHKAAAMVLVHNHPSGDPTPSQDDLSVTRELIAAGRLMGIPVNDHVIIGHHAFVSLRERGLRFE